MDLHFTNTYAFCPSCGGRLDTRVIKAGDRPRHVCRECGFIYFQNPKIATGAIVTHEDRLVLLRRAIEPGYGKWVFPGGYVDMGERVSEAARREVREEACVEVKIEKLLNIYSYPERPVVVVVYVAEVCAGMPAAGDETLEMRLFGADEIPWDDLAFPSTREALEDFLAQWSRSGMR